MITNTIEKMVTYFLDSECLPKEDYGYNNLSDIENLRENILNLKKQNTKLILENKKLSNKRVSCIVKKKN
jgi:hypothetical protein